MFVAEGTKKLKTGMVFISFCVIFGCPELPTIMSFFFLTVRIYIIVLPFALHRCVGTGRLAFGHRET